MGLLSWLQGKNVETRTDGVATAVPARVVWQEDSYPVHAVGVSFYQDEFERLFGGHTRQGHHVYCDALLCPEPTNQYDPNAIMVTVSGRKIGHLSREQALRIGEVMKERGHASLMCAAQIVGGWRTNQYDEGYYGCQLNLNGWGPVVLSTDSD